MKNVKAKYVELDYLRIIACIIVFLYHLKIVQGGYLVVCTFFVLTGYLSCLTTLKKEKFSIKEYYLNRLKKIYLPLLLVVSLTIVIVNLIPSIRWLNMKQESISVLLGFNNYWQLNANLDYFTRHVNSPFIHMWYIAILLQFELLFPWIYLLLKKLSKNIRTIIITIVTVSLATLFYLSSKKLDIMSVYYNSLLRSFSIMFGVLLSIINLKYNIYISKGFSRYKNKILFIYYFILLGLCLFVSDNSNYYAIMMIIVSLISCRIIEYATLKKNISSHKVISYLSSISYEIYLIQYPVIFVMQLVKMNFILKTISIIIITILMSIFVHYLVSLSKNKKIIFLKKLVCLVVIVIGLFEIVTAKDNTQDMKKLEDELAKNLQVINKKNKEFENSKKQKDEEWKKTLESLDSERENLENVIREMPVVGIGDSVMLGTIHEFYKQFPNGYFDGKVSRTIYGAEDLLNELKNKGMLTDTLIFSLATNGDYSKRRNDELMEIVGDREVYWINAVGADDPEFNNQFAEYAKDFNNLHIVEWDKCSKNHPEAFYSDGIHLRENQANYYVDCVYQTIYNNMKEKQDLKREELIKNHEDEENLEIEFYGNMLLINAYSYLKDEYNDSVFNSKKDYTYKQLYKDLKNKVDDNSLDKKIVLLFDRELKITKDDYQKIVNLCKDYKLYVVNINSQKISFDNDNVKVLNFNQEIEKNKDYLIDDGIHLSKKGNKALVKYLLRKIN